MVLFSAYFPIVSCLVLKAAFHMRASHAVLVLHSTMMLDYAVLRGRHSASSQSSTATELVSIAVGSSSHATLIKVPTPV